MERIDTHGHLSETIPSLRDETNGWAQFKTAQDLTGSRIAAEGCRALHGIDPGALLRPDAPDEVFRRSESLRKNGLYEAFDVAFERSRIRKQIIFADCLPERMRPFPQGHTDGSIYYLAYIDNIINGNGKTPSPEYGSDSGSFYGTLRTFLDEMRSIDDYLDAIDNAIDNFRSWGAIGLKSAMAYTFGLAVLDPSYGEAKEAFARKESMTMADWRVVHDYAFRRSLSACGRNELPVVIHTGYQIWGKSSLSQANPMLLHPLLVDQRYEKITFVLLHGGNPYVGETTYLAGQFRNVIIDFTWISWMTPSRFKLALSEWLNVVPHDRICWGSDSGSPESVAGTDSITRKLIAEVLEDELRNGTIDPRYGYEFVENSYLRTPARLFGL